MKLRELLAGADVAEIAGDADVEIAGLAYDSRRSSPGTLFFCVPGFTRRRARLRARRGRARRGGARRRAPARARRAPGARRATPAPRWRRGGALLRRPDRRAAGRRDHRHERQDDHRVPGPPRPRGAPGSRPGCSGTVKRSSAAVEEPVERTTPEAIDLQAHLPAHARRGRRGLRDGGLLARARAAPRRRRSTSPSRVFTNLTQDHLDFHADMEDYFLAKRRLFAGAAAPSVRSSTSTTPTARRLAAEFDARSPSRPPATSAPTCARVDVALRRLRVALPAARPRDGEVERRSRRCPAASTSRTRSARSPPARALGVGLSDAAAALAERRPGAGPLRAGRRGPAVRGARRLRAHAGLARERAARRARRCTDGRLIVRLRLRRRPRPRQAAADGRDRRRGSPTSRVVTSDNPRSEDPEAIIAEILAGIAAPAAEVEVEPDRRAAIALALGARRPGDMVVIAGKGHEQGQEFEGGRKVPFDDREVAREELRALAAARRGVIELAAERIAAAAGAEVAARGAGRRPARAVIDSREVGAGRPLLRPARASTPTAASSPPRRSRPAPGASSSSPRARAATLASRRRRRLGARRRRPARRRCRRSPAPGGASSAARVVGITGSVGKTSVKDICRGAAAAARVHASRENFNTEIGLPLTMLGRRPSTEVLVLEMAMRGRGPDRRAVRDRRARRRGDHQRRPGPPRAARLGRGDRRGEGRAPRRARRRRPRGRPGRRRGARAAPAPTSSRRSRSAPAATCSRSSAEATRPAIRGGDRDPGGRRDARVPLRPRRTTSPTRWRDRDRRRARRRRSARWPSGAGHIASRALRGERVELPGRRRRSSTTATTPTRSRCAPRSTTSPRCAPAGRRVAVLGEMAELGPDGPGYHREVGAHARGLGDRRAWSASASSPATTRADELGRRTPRRRSSCSPSSLEPGDASWSRARARSGSSAHRRLVAGRRRRAMTARRRSARSPRRDRPRRGPDRRDGGDADLHLPRPEVHRVPAGAGVRPADPRGGAAGAPRQGRARRRWAG